MRSQNGFWRDTISLYPMADRFYERYWGARDDEHLSDFALKWPKLMPFIPLVEGITIVDFGCGAGAILREIRKLNPHAHLVGLDVSEQALKRAMSTIPGCEFHRVDDGGRFPLENSSVDFIFSSEVIEHVYDTENAFKEMVRILKHGGRTLLTTPYHGFWKNLIIIFFGFDRHFSPTGPHIRFFSKRTLFGLLKENGFKILTHGFYGRFYPLSHSIFVLAEK